MGACCSIDKQSYSHSITLQNPVIESLTNDALFVHGRHNGKTYFFTVEQKACQIKGAKMIKVNYEGDIVRTDNTVFQVKEVANVQRA